MMCRKKWTSAIHPSLHFIQNKQRSVLPTQRLRRRQVFMIRNPYAAFRLQWLQEECCIAACREFLFEGLDISKGHRVCVRKEWAKSIAPVFAIHQRKRATGETVK